MSKQLYNEGRVVGYSAYEIYVKHLLSSDPSVEPASEKEWLASSIASGSSLLLKISPDMVTNKGWYDIPLPSNSHLCATNIIIGSLFIGEAQVEGNSPWAYKVTDYGPLISNVNNSSPNGANVPVTSDMVAFEASLGDKLKQYSKIIDGIIIQPGTWVDNNTLPPKKDFIPDLSSPPTLRILLEDNVTADFCVLLTGFTNRSVIAGVTGTDGSTQTTSPEDGDFLGPAIFPWANKVIFSTPNALIKQIDSVIPGMVKLFEGEAATDDAIAYEAANPDNYALIRDDSYKLHQLNGNNVLPVADLDILPLNDNNMAKVGDYVDLKVGAASIPILALGTLGSNPYTISSNPAGTYTNDYILLKDILSGLMNNYRIDILEEVLRDLKTNLTGSGSNYLEFSNGRRLYVSSTAPTGTPRTGDIGIGW